MGERIRRDGLDSTALLLRAERRVGDEGLLMISFSFAEPLEFTLAARDRLVRATGEGEETETSSVALFPSLLDLARVFSASSVRLATVSSNRLCLLASTLELSKNFISFTGFLIHFG